MAQSGQLSATSIAITWSVFLLLLLKEIKNENTLEAALCYVIGFEISEVESASMKVMSYILSDK